MQSVYAVYGSRLHLILEDEVAEAYNRFQSAFFEAQRVHKETHGKPWEPTEPLVIECEKRDQEVWNEFAAIMNSMCALNGGGLSITEEEMTSDYLVKL